VRGDYVAFETLNIDLNTKNLNTHTHTHTHYHNHLISQKKNQKNAKMHRTRI
jgi:hypothetical protein